MIGTTVGNFQIIASLGRGGMGEVWLAQQPNLKTRVAIKVLAADISRNEGHVRRFQNEALAVSQIAHSGIVKIFDGAFLPDGRAYLVMEYLEGESLARRIKRMGRLELPLIADFGRQIASVLDATHEAGIIHRDLKPDNIYLVRDAELRHGERVKILDFGIAKLDTTTGANRMTAATTSSIGTPNYMSPEQWHSLADAGWPTDAYALGCVAFEMATGRPPFVAGSRVEVCAMHLEQPPPAPSRFAHGLPGELDRLIVRLLDKEPARRPGMREAIGVFTALAQGQGLALSTLPPGAVMPPLAASPESSMQYRTTPRAMAAAAATDVQRQDTHPQPEMSLQFKPTPPAGLAAQDAGPSKHRVKLVAIAAAVAVAIAIVIVTTRSSSPEQQASGSGGSVGSSGSGGVARTGSGSAVAEHADDHDDDDGDGDDTKLRRLPPRKEPVAMPEIDEPLALVVCLDTDGEVESVTLPNGGLPPKPVDAAVSSWEYVPYSGRDGVAKPVCGRVTIPARVRGGAVTPARLTKKLFNDGVGGINEGIFACTRFAPPGGKTFSVSVAVSPDGIGTLKAFAVTGEDTQFPRLRACIADAIKNVRFAKTKLGGQGTTTVQLN